MFINKVCTMNIGFDAKRIFWNTTGLGNYSRTLISAMKDYFPDNNYYLFTPAVSCLFDSSGEDSVRVITPISMLHKMFSSLWRSKWVTGDIENARLDIYHGLSNEIPFGIHRLPVKTVVTIHDLIFERYPHQYNPLDVITYRRKAQYACRFADRVIAISKQTRKDLIEFYHVPEEKISVIYQACDSVFEENIPHLQQYDIRLKYHLPDQFLLYVGSVVERKNLLTLIQSLDLLPGDMSLVIVGDGHYYKNKVKAYLLNHDHVHPVIWLSEMRTLPQCDLAVIYKLARALIYPSIFEGFGLPILEALKCGTPVITSVGSCFKETAGDAAIFVDPMDKNTLAQAIYKIWHSEHLRQTMRQKGFSHARHFMPFISASRVIEIYSGLLSKDKVSGLV